MRFEAVKEGNFIGHRDAVFALQKEKGSPFFYSASADGLLVKWNSEINEPGVPVAKFNNSVYAFHIDYEKDLLFALQNFEGLHKINIKEKKQIANLKLGKNRFFTMALNLENIYIGTSAGEIIQCNKESLRGVKKAIISENSIRKIIINKQTNELIAASSDHHVYILDLKTLEIKHSIKHHQNSVFSLAMGPKNKLLVSGGRDAKLVFYDVENNYEIIEEIVAHNFTINDICFNDSGTLFATGSKDKAIKIWNSNNFKLVKVIDKGRHPAHTSSVNSIIWQEHLFASSDDKSISKWKIKEIIK